MNIVTVAEVINRISSGFENACSRIMADNADIIRESILDQLLHGRSGDGTYLSPDYESDPFFNEPGRWKGRNRLYMEWKKSITPPPADVCIGFPSRPDHVPNLYINGFFYKGIMAVSRDNMIETSAAEGLGTDIVNKYGDEILNIGPEAKKYFIENYLLPLLAEYYSKCGWK